MEKLIHLGETSYVERYEDEALAAIMATDKPVSFVVLDDEWDQDLTVRTIKRAEILA